MPTRSTRTLVDEVAEGAVSVRGDVDQLRGQAALVRALVDQLDAYHPEDPVVGALHNQLSDELDRLARMASVGDVSAVDAAPIDILVVDDEASARDAMRRALEALEYPCRVAASAVEALAELERRPAAIVLTDWSMPGGMSGLELCVALRQREPHPYVIVATGFPEEARALEGMRDSADDFLSKPVDLDDLESRLAAATRLIRAVRLVSRVNDRLRMARPAT